MYYMTFVEETDMEYKRALKLWRTTENKVLIEVGIDDGDPHEMQNIILDVDDATLLLNELSKIVQGMIEVSESETTLPLWAEKEKEEKKKLFQKPE